MGLILTQYARSRYELICIASSNSLWPTHGAIAPALHNFLCVRARLGAFQHPQRSTCSTFGSVEGRKITVERFVFNYIIRAKLFPKSSNYKYQRYLCLYPIVRNRVIWALPSCNPIDFFLPCGPAKFNKRCDYWGFFYHFFIFYYSVIQELD